MQRQGRTAQQRPEFSGKQRSSVTTTRLASYSTSPILHCHLWALLFLSYLAMGDDSMVLNRSLYL